MKKYNTTLLVIDDDPNDLYLIERTFRLVGVHGPIQLLESGVEAIDYLKGNGRYADRNLYAYPTFIMTDLNMPCADGFTVLEYLKSNPESAIIPTVVLTSSHDKDDIKKSYMLGASSYHVKPQSPEKLQQLLKILHEYWMSCEVPQVDRAGRRLVTESKGKLGERFPQS